MKSHISHLVCINSGKYNQLKVPGNTEKIYCD